MAMIINLRQQSRTVGTICWVFSFHGLSIAFQKNRYKPFIEYTTNPPRKSTVVENKNVFDEARKHKATMSIDVHGVSFLPSKFSVAVGWFLRTKSQIETPRLETQIGSQLSEVGLSAKKVKDCPTFRRPQLHARKPRAHKDYEDELLGRHRCLVNGYFAARFHSCN